ncbi:UNVERIFIED_CONTAM: putative protein, mitochondrial [Sesamum latifolium]|uniref:Mitochondrial glycoprotein family protein n=1 Tax=Sesamum latifolium TaxID=2727402 RepID=A0AAW2XI95_9LAMI
MAFNNAIRRAASRVVPLAFRAAAGSQRYLHNHQSSALFPAINSPSRNLLQRSFPLFSHHYSTKPSSDEALLRVIESEIQCAVESQDEEEAEEVPQGFPFKIEDHPGQQTITLTREYQGGKGNQSSIPLVVRVSKKSGPSLEFGCTAYPDEVAIDSLAVKDTDNSEDQIAYDGPDFADLDENLQKAFHKYLELRGIKPSTTNFLHGYMVDKDSREYITWLKNLRSLFRRKNQRLVVWWDFFMNGTTYT